MQKPAPLFLVLITPIFILLANYLTIYGHDFAHSLMAWLLGFKNNPFAINFGGCSLLNLIFLINAGENVDYGSIYMMGHRLSVALIAFAGPGIVNVGLFFLSLYLLNKKSIQQNIYLYYFLFWLNLTNLGGMYDYVPIRTFSTQGDLGHITTSLQISPWSVFIVFGYLVAFAIWYFFTQTLIKMFAQLQIMSVASQAFTIILCVLILFGYYGGAGFTVKDSISQFLSTVSIISIPGIIVACWPNRNWVKKQFHQYYHSQY